MPLGSVMASDASSNAQSATCGTHSRRPRAYCPVMNGVAASASAPTASIARWALNGSSFTIPSGYFVIVL